MTKQPHRRWVVTKQSPGVLHAVVVLMKTDPEALEDGRVFVNRKRVLRPDHPLREGDIVDAFPKKIGPPAPFLQILENKNGIVAVSKPEGLPTIPDQRGTTSLLSLLATELNIPIAKLHPTSRLDVGVSGVVLFAATEEARDSLRLARENGRYRRHYLAICSSAPVPEHGIIDLPIGRTQNPRARKVEGKDAIPSQTHYRTAARAGSTALVGVEPVTGRTHQIRVHLAHLKAPLVGDTTYGAAASITLASGSILNVGRIALHAAWVSVTLGENAEAWIVRDPIPTSLLDLWKALGGHADDWKQALLPLSSP